MKDMVKRKAIEYIFIALGVNTCVRWYIDGIELINLPSLLLSSFVSWVVMIIIACAVYYLLSKLPERSLNSTMENEEEMEPREAIISINGYLLTDAQAMCIRSSVSEMLERMQTVGPGDDQMGVAIKDGDIANLNDISGYIHSFDLESDNRRT